MSTAAGQTTVTPTLREAASVLSRLDGKQVEAVSIEIGAYNTLVWRLGVAVLLTGGIYVFTRPTLPSRATMKVHFGRSILVAVMAIAFFWGIVRVPLAEAIALSFIAPLIALGLAALFLKESITAQSVWGSLLGLAGVAVVVAGRVGGTHSEETMLGMAAVLFSAVVYAMNLVVARHQAQLAKPLEIAFFQNLFVLGLLAMAAPWWLAVPAAQHWPGISAAALLAIVSLLLALWALQAWDMSLSVPLRADGDGLFSLMLAKLLDTRRKGRESYIDRAMAELRFWPATAANPAARPE